MSGNSASVHHLVAVESHESAPGASSEAQPAKRSAEHLKSVLLLRPGREVVEARVRVGAAAALEPAAAIVRRRASLALQECSLSNITGKGKRVTEDAFTTLNV